MLKSLFNPSSIAVIGASREPGKVGYEILKNVITSGYKGNIYPINPNADEILGYKCYSRVIDVKTHIDLGVVAVPAQVVPTIIKEIGQERVKNLIIISAGFKETGVEGAKLENQVISFCKKNRIRVLGPNALGIIDTHTPLNASFAPRLPLKGNIAFISQSGALGTAVLDWAWKKRIGFSKFVSLGNKADVEESDLIQALIDDETTKVVLMYIEGLQNGQRFIKIAQEITRSKPLIVLKSGITSAGVRAVSSHTGSMAGSDLAYSTAFKQAGIIRATSTEALFDFAKAFSTQPIPNGINLAIITNAGGPGILATDASEKYGLKIAPISGYIVDKLRQELPAAANFFNPIDVLGDASAKRYRFAMETALNSEDVHSALIILTPQAMTEPIQTAEAIIELKKMFPEKPVVTAFLGGETTEEAIEKLIKAETPNYEFPERAIQALSALYKYGEYRGSSTDQVIPRFKIDRKKVLSILKRVTEDRRVNLKAFEASEILNAYGINSPSIRFAVTDQEAVAYADEIGYPIVMKIESPHIHHKTDIGGVKLNVNSADEVRTSFYELIGRAYTFLPQASIEGVTIQKMIPSGREIIIGMNRDLTFGPLIMFGLGGIYVNFLKDVSFRLSPLTKKKTLEMIKETKAYTLLKGIRGEPSSDINCIVDVILRVSQLVSDFTEITEMDINPLFVYEQGKGCSALDVKMTIKAM